MLIKGSKCTKEDIFSQTFLLDWNLPKHHQYRGAYLFATLHVIFLNIIKICLFLFETKTKNKNHETKSDNFLKTFFLLNIWRNRLWRELQYQRECFPKLGSWFLIFVSTCICILWLSETKKLRWNASHHLTMLDLNRV